MDLLVLTTGQLRIFHTNGTAMLQQELSQPLLPYEQLQLSTASLPWAFISYNSTMVGRCGISLW
ncbi:MAG: hypothetical protein R2795_13930 [Saprospiraceae bacterium]